MLTAPPLTLTLLGSRPSLRMFARATTLNASLISHNAMSSMLRPACFNALGIASDGAIGKSTGRVAASANAANTKNSHSNSINVVTGAQAELLPS